MERRIVYGCVLVLAAAVCGPLLAQGEDPRVTIAPEPAAQLLNVKGSVEVKHAGEPAAKATLLTPLQPGDLVRVQTGGRAEVVFVGTGARFGLASGSAAVVT